MNAIVNPNVFGEAITKAGPGPLASFMARPVPDALSFRHIQASTAIGALLFADPRTSPGMGLQASAGYASGAPSAAGAPDWRELPNANDDLVEKAFDRLIDLKVTTATVAMHLRDAWRTGLFRQLDDLLDEDNWHSGDTLPTEASYRTFLRLIVMLGHPPRPSLGCTDNGNIIAAWRRADSRLTIECGADDGVRWVLSRSLADDVESAAGTCKLRNLRSRLEPYDPEVWFVGDDHHPRR